MGNMATGTFVSATINADGTTADVLWSIATTWGTLAIVAGKSAYFTLGGVNYPLSGVVQQTDPAGDGSTALVRFNLSGILGTGTATFTAQSGFLTDAFTNITPASTGAATTNNSTAAAWHSRARNWRTWRFN